MIIWQINLYDAKVMVEGLILEALASASVGPASCLLDSLPDLAVLVHLGAVVFVLFVLPLLLPCLGALLLGLPGFGSSRGRGSTARLHLTTSLDLERE